MSVEVFTIEKSEPYESDQVSIYQEMFASGKTVARPVYDKVSLLTALQNSTNVRCLNIKASVIAGLGYTFKDEDNAKSSGVLDFTNSLYSKDNSPKPFSLLCKDWVLDYLSFGESRLEIVRIGKKPVNLLVLSGKNTLISLDRQSIYQWDRSRNKIVEFKRYSQYNKTVHDTLCLSDSNPIDDYYGLPCFVSALPSMKENLRIVQSNIESLENIIDPSLMILVTGQALSPDQKLAIKEGLNQVRNKRSSAIIIDAPEKDAVINVQNFGAKTTDGNYIQERESIKNEIIGLHGLTPELYGMISSGGISSGEKATGSLKIFVQTTINPVKEVLEKLLTEFFRNEFPTFSKENEIIFNSIDLTDSQEDSVTSLTQSQTYQSYVTLGSLTLFNEYRNSIGLKEFTEQEWSNLLSGGLGLEFNVNKNLLFKD